MLVHSTLPAAPVCPSPLISLVVPTFNESNGLPFFYTRAVAALEATGCPFEWVFVNDGSTDATLAALQNLRQHDPRIGIVNFARNFGKEVATTAGLDHARGDVVVLIDADLQDPPELIGPMLEKWREGFDVVVAVRKRRGGEAWFKRASAFVFYRVLRRVASVNIPADAGDFRLMSRRVVDAVCQLRERNRYMKGVLSWVGFRSAAVPFDRPARAHGSSAWNFRKLTRLAFDGVASFSSVPLKIATWLGSVVAGLAFLYATYIFAKTLLFGDPVRGYPTIMVSVLFLGGVQLICIGLLGEYLGRVFDEVKQRPLYIVESYQPPSTGEDAPTYDVKADSRPAIRNPATSR